MQNMTNMDPALFFVIFFAIYICKIVICKPEIHMHNMSKICPKYAEYAKVLGGSNTVILQRGRERERERERERKKERERERFRY